MPPEDLVRRHVWAIAAHFWPGAVVTDRSALAPDARRGWVFLAHPAPPRRSDLALPGVTVSCRVGSGPLPGDTPFMGQTALHLAGTARSLVENTPTGGRPPRGRSTRAAGQVAVGDRIDNGGGGRESNPLRADSGHPV